MRRKEFLENVAVPLLGIAVVMLIVYPFCVENGVCDYRKLWIVSGIPFGVQKMYFWMIPKGFDIGGTVGMFAFNLLVGGLIGSMVLTWFAYGRKISVKEHWIWWFVDSKKSIQDMISKSKNKV